MNKYLERIKDLPPFSGRDECKRFSAAFPSLDVMQANIGKKCNLACKHCHIEAGPNRAELMNRDVMRACLDAFEKQGFKTLDITGGAPELNPDFQWFVREAVGRGIHVIVRTNLAILSEGAFESLPEFYARNKTELAGSLPYYTERDTDRQRGEGVFAASIAGLRRLNGLGYGSDP
jgi:radical SAM/Cys-rich protein